MKLHGGSVQLVTARAADRGLRAVQRAGRIRQRVRRETRKALDRRTRRTPTLSVVVPVYNVREWVGAALQSVLDQSLTDLEVIVVDDGSTDGSIDVVRRYAESDPRIKILSRENAGLGAARNAGADVATGRFLAFIDSDDLVLPGAYEAMVGQLQRSGSDFCTAAFARGDEREQVQPNWVSTWMGETRQLRTIAQDPWLLLDITAWNKVFRRSFWRRHQFRFTEGVRYEDQVPITRAWLNASHFDVLKQRVYVWRTRSDGSSITQQKANILDLTDRLLSMEGCALLLRDAPPVVREVWYQKLLGYDLPNYLVAALTADANYIDMLTAHLHRLRSEVPDEVWERVAFRNRAMLWVMAEHGVGAARSLRVIFERERFGLPVDEHDGDLRFEVPGLDQELVPPWIRRVCDVDVQPVARLTHVRWEGDQLVLRGSAYLFPLPVSSHPHHLEVRLVGPNGLVVPVPTTRYSSPEFESLSGVAYAEVAASGFVARIDAAELATVAPEGQCSFRLEIRQRQDGHERVTNITHVFNLGAGGSRQPRVVRDRMLRLSGVVEHGLSLAVHDTFALLTDAVSAQSAEPDRTPAVRLTLEEPERDPVVTVALSGRSGEEEVLAHSRADRGGVEVDLHPGAGRTLVTRHRSGRRVAVMWALEPNVIGTTAGGFVHRGATQDVRVDRLKPAVALHSVEAHESALYIRGTSMGAAGSTLLLSGSRAESSPSAKLPDGDFSLAVPLLQDPWGLGPSALPADTYELELRSGTSPDPGGSEVMHVKADTTVRGRMPLDVEGDRQSLRVGLTHTWTLTAHAREVGLRDSHPRRQQALRTQTYARARHGQARDAVLFEAFAGRTTGDSPGAIANELIRRGTSLDLVWSVGDGSVPVPQGTRAVHRTSAEWWELLGSARYLVNNNNFMNGFVKADHQTYVQTWHGTPLKKIANDIADRRWFSTSYLRTMEYEATVWDHLVSPSPYCTQILPRAFGYQGSVLEVGYPRNDVLSGPDRDFAREEVRRRLGIDPGVRVLLYAPTWRETARSRRGYAKILYLDLQRTVDALPGSVVLFRGHANTASSDSVWSSRDRGVLDVTLYPDINDLFLASDMLITDYSSVMFDYAVLDRPQAFLVPDLESYRDSARGFYFDFAKEAPGPLFSDTDSLLDHLRDPDATDGSYADARRNFRERFAPLDDGRAAARVVDAVFGDE
jgi:CDP-glycerol glycerophosphotransferase